MDYSYLRSRARSSLTGNWGVAIAAMLIVGAVTSLSSLDYFDDTLGTIGMIIALVLLPLNVGYARFHYNMALGKTGDFSDIFSAFNSLEYGRALGTLILQSIYIFLWFLLLIIPGIIKAFSYAMTIYILQDPDFKHLSPNEAIGQSMKMMDGHKANLFVLGLSFIGWIFLSIFTFGILLFYVAPYMEQAIAEFYLHIKDERLVQTTEINKEDDWLKEY